MEAQGGEPPPPPSPSTSFRKLVAACSKRPTSVAPPSFVKKLDVIPEIDLPPELPMKVALSLSERGLVGQFMGLWPSTRSTDNWIQRNWRPLITSSVTCYAVGRGYFIFEFISQEDRDLIFRNGPYFMGTQGLYLNRWTPSFDPASEVPKDVPVWVRLPNLSIHCWNPTSLQAIGNGLGRYIDRAEPRDQYSCAQICVEVDLEVGLPEAIKLKVGDWHHFQKLDYEQLPFKCRGCHEYGHFQRNCPKNPPTEKAGEEGWQQAQKGKSKPKGQRNEQTVPPNAKSSGTKDTENNFSILAKEVDEGEPVPSKEVQEGAKGDQNSEDKGNQPTEEEGAQNKQAEARKQYKAVTEVQVQNKTIADPEGIKQAAYEDFEMLYTEPKGTETDQQRYPLTVIPRLINEDTNNRLTREVTQQEIKEALDQMNPDKAPGPDGFTARFYQQCWNIIKKDLTKMIKKSQQSSKLGGSTNSSFLALIPKEKGALSFNRFRPISLCNTSYKILTKVIANRLKALLPLIVPENQGGFVKGRHIADNIILVQEAIHSSVRRKEKGMVIKLDLANAFDRVRHEFLFEVMRKFGFDTKFVNWIKACIGSPWIAPLVNGKVTNFFKASRGLRQGCPLSPLLYAIQASVLSYQLGNAQVHKNLQGLRIVQGVKDINHAQFADDTLLLGGESPIIAKKFKEELDAYAAASGSEISQAKSNIYGWNITPNEMLGITRALGMEGHTNWEAFKYLGIPIFKNAPRTSHWNHLVEKLKNKFSSWGVNWLNLAGKAVLIKSVVSSIPIYQSSLLLAPATVIQRIEAFQRRFLWEGGRQARRKLHLISWEKTSNPFLEGGLNFKKTRVQNLALGAKLLWKMVTGKPS
jgi:hypothetical protein